MFLFVGREILLVMPKGLNQRTLEALLVDEGFLVTCIDDVENALELLSEKFFVCVLFDLDWPTRNMGMQWVRRTRAASPQTHAFVVAMETCPAAVAIAAYRAGARDMFLYNPKDMENMASRMSAAAAETVRRMEMERLFSQVRTTHEQFFRHMTRLYIELLEARELDVDTLLDAELPLCRVLVVDENPFVAKSLNLTHTDGWEVHTVPLGSLALECAQQYHVVLIARNLPDLTGSLVATTVRKEENIRERHEIFVYTLNLATPERILLFEVRGNIGEEDANDLPSDHEFTEKDARPVDVLGKPVSLPFPSMLVERLRKYRRDALRQERRRHFMATFKAEQFDFIQQHEQLQKAIDSFLTTQPT